MLQSSQDLSQLDQKEITETISLMDLILRNEKQGNNGSDLSHGSHPEKWKWRNHGSDLDLILRNEKQGNHGSSLCNGSHPYEWKRRKLWKQSLSWISSWEMKKKEFMEAISLMDLILMNENEGNHGSDLSHGSHLEKWKRRKSWKQSL